ncbi:hypothetical protein BHE74_00021680 [Ensete ventricosum]|nr:hypothetical protein GW17_00050702 [Ensete ventricosum]RWW70665.1 hypothetical protein BHE74_00021680 [Ensete ventricosum]
MEVAFIEYQPSVPTGQPIGDAIRPDLADRNRERQGFEVGEGMPLKTFDADLSNFDQVFGRFTKSETTEGSPSEPDQLKFLLFLADKDPSTNRSWCPGTLFHVPFPLLLS